MRLTSPHPLLLIPFSKTESIAMTALIFGVTGQMGFYLSQLLLSLNYKVIGVARRTSVDNTIRLKPFLDNPNFVLEQGDVTDAGSVFRIVNQHQANKVFNLAAQSHVKVSFDEPQHTAEVNLVGVLNILEAIRLFSPHSRFVQCSTSEMFGSSYSTKYIRREGYIADDLFSASTPSRMAERFNEKYEEIRFQDERTPFLPNSPYAVAKVGANHACRLYRESYGLYTSSGILFNYESEHRGETFVTRKISKYVASLKRHLDFCRKSWHEVFFNHPPLCLGNLDAKRDWGYAGDTAKALYLLSEQSGKPEDFVVATGETHSVREFLTEAFALIGVSDWTPYVEINQKFCRPCEVPYLRGESTRIQEKLGWTPSVSFKQLVRIMVEHDCGCKLGCDERNLQQV